MCTDIGVPIAKEKTFKPAQVMSFLGIELDVTQNIARLPADKLQKCKTLVHQALAKSKITLRELQSLIGSLNFACRVVSPGRTFLQRLINLTIGKSIPYHKIRLNNSAKLDLQAWALFLESFNGECFFLHDPWLHSESLHLHSDTSKQGFGAVYGPCWLYGQFPPPWQALDIWILELHALFAAFYTWRQHFKDKKVMFHCDNNNIVQVLISCTSPNVYVMSMIRHLVVSAMQINCHFRAVHIQGAKNYLSDFLSRSQVRQFKEAHPGSDTNPTQGPQEILPENFTWV
jgi:hypothetical protein